MTVIDTILLIMIFTRDIEHINLYEKYQGTIKLKSLMSNLEDNILIIELSEDEIAFLDISLDLLLGLSFQKRYT